MESIDLTRSPERAWKRRLHNELLAALCTLAAACELGDPPVEQPTLGEMTAEAEPKPSEEPATTPSSVESERPATRDSGGQKPAPAAPPGQVAGDAGGTARPDVTAPPTQANNTANPLGPGVLGSLPASPTAPVLSALDAGVPVPDLSMLTPDAAVSLACASEFAGCVLANVLESGPCLDKYGSCEPGFRGGDGGIDGTCAVRFSACVLENPIAFERCFPRLTECAPAP